MSAELFRILVVFIWSLAAYGYSSGNQLDHACSLLVAEDYFNFLVSAVQYMDVSCIHPNWAVPPAIFMSLQTYEPAMKTVAALLDDMFEDVEYSQPAGAFTAAGHRVVTVGMKRGKTVTGKAHGTRVTIEVAVSDARVRDFDALFIPGGYSPDRLRAHPEPVTFVREFVLSGKPVLGICHAAQLLISAQVLTGRRITGYVSIIQDIKNAGAEFVDEPVVEDGNFVFSRDPRDIPAFITASLEKLGE